MREGRERIRDIEGDEVVMWRSGQSAGSWWHQIPAAAFGCLAPEEVPCGTNAGEADFRRDLDVWFTMRLKRGVSGFDKGRRGPLQLERPRSEGQPTAVCPGWCEGLPLFHNIPEARCWLFGAELRSWNRS